MDEWNQVDLPCASLYGTHIHSTCPDAHYDDQSTVTCPQDMTFVNLLPPHLLVANHFCAINMNGDQAGDFSNICQSELTAGVYQRTLLGDVCVDSKSNKTGLPQINQ